METQTENNLLTLTFGAVANALAQVAPPALAESYDNVGLLVGEDSNMVREVMTCLDVTEEVVDEAILTKCNLIVSHHPLIFKGLKRLNGNNATERTLLKAIRNNIGIIACHTNLDNTFNGVSIQLAHRLGLQSPKVLQPMSGQLGQMAVFIPNQSVEAVLAAAFEAGAGHVGLYDQCAFRVNGVGSYRPLAGSNPVDGKINQLSIGPETKVEFIYPNYLQDAILRAVKSVHPYEEVAYNTFTMTNKWEQVGAGAIGLLPEPMTLVDFLDQVKSCLGITHLKYTDLDRQVQRIAVGGGTCSFLIDPAKRAGADVLVTADIKYHEWFEADGQIAIVDIGHYESEIHTNKHLASLLSEKFPNIAVRLTTVITNPVKHH